MGTAMKGIAFDLDETLGVRHARGTIRHEYRHRHRLGPRRPRPPSTPAPRPEELEDRQAACPHCSQKFGATAASTSSDYYERRYGAGVRVFDGPRRYRGARVVKCQACQAESVFGELGGFVEPLRSQRLRTPGVAKASGGSTGWGVVCTGHWRPGSSSTPNGQSWRGSWPPVR